MFAASSSLPASVALRHTLTSMSTVAGGSGQAAWPPLRDTSLLRSQGFINGEWVAADGGDVLDVRCPATNAVVGTVPDMGAAETRRAIEAANAAWPEWRARTGKERAAVLRRWFDLMMEHQEDLATIMTAECGKPLAEARAEISYAASFVEWFAEEAKRVYGDVIPSHVRGKRIMVLKQPIGVVGAITPWNFPSAMITRKCAPALAVGCPVVVKPSELTPLSALALADLGARAGLPAGTFNIVVGGSARAAEIGSELCEHPAVRKIGFTGSTAVGKLLMRQSASTVKKVSLELGGNAPFIVFDDADLDAAVDGAIASKFRNAGQTCVCANRIFVQAGIHDAFATRLAERVRGMRQGNGFDEGVVLGPLIDERAVDKVATQVDDARSKGATVLVGGARAAALGPNFYEPTVLSGASAAMEVFREETFGPLAALFRFASESEVVRLANDTPYGLAAYVFTRDLGRAWRMSEALEYGMVGINEGAMSTEVAPFGGVKESGLGREGSKYGAEEFIEPKYVLMGGLGEM